MLHSLFYIRYSVSCPGSCSPVQKTQAPLTNPRTLFEKVLDAVARRLMREDFACLVNDHAARLGRRQAAGIDIGDHRILKANRGVAAEAGGLLLHRGVSE